MSRYLRFLWALPALALLASGSAKIVQLPSMVENMQAIGAEDILLPLGLIELACVAVFLIPKTRLLGFFLLCSYMGGIIATEWISSGFPLPGLLLESLLWIGMYFERPSLFALKPSSTSTAEVSDQASALSK